MLEAGEYTVYVGNSVKNCVVGAGVKVEKMGAVDTFGKSGKAAELIDEFGISARFIVEKAKKAITLK